MSNNGSLQRHLCRLINEQNIALAEAIPNNVISSYNGEYFQLVDAVRDLAGKMGVEPVELCNDVVATLQASRRRR